MSAKKENINKKHIRVHLDAIFHDPTRLQDEIALQNAMGVLMGHLKNPMVDKKSLLADMLLRPNLFEFIFAGKSPQCISRSFNLRSDENTRAEREGGERDEGLHRQCVPIEHSIF